MANELIFLVPKRSCGEEKLRGRFCRFRCEAEDLGDIPVFGGVSPYLEKWESDRPVPLLHDDASAIRQYLISYNVANFKPVGQPALLLCSHLRTGCLCHVLYSSNSSGVKKRLLHMYTTGAGRVLFPVTSSLNTEDMVSVP